MVLGDLMLDVVLAPDRALETGTDVPGRVGLVQGGGHHGPLARPARAQTTLICAVGRDTPGRALVDAVRADGVTPRVRRVQGARTGRIGVFVAPGGERSFVADRGAADLLRPEDVRPAWFRGTDALHVPAYSLLGEPLGLAGRRAIELARAAGAIVSVDLASIAPLLAEGRQAARSLIAGDRPDLLFATALEAEVLIGRYPVEWLLEFAPMAVVKRGPKGATVLAVETGASSDSRWRPSTFQAADTTGAGDAFDAGFLVGWFAARAAGRSTAASLQRAALAGHRAATRQLTTPRPELSLS